MNGTEGQVAGPSRIGIHPAGPVPNNPPRRSPRSIDNERRAIQLSREEAAIQADLEEAAKHPVDDDCLTAGTETSLHWGSNLTELHEEYEPPSREHPYPLPRHMQTVLFRTDSEIARLPSMAEMEEAEVEAITRTRAPKELTFHYNDDGSLYIVGDRSMPEFQDLLWVIRNGQRADHQLEFRNPNTGSIHETPDDPMEGIINEDGAATATPAAAPVSGVGETNAPIAGPSNLQAGQTNPKYSNRGCVNLEEALTARSRLHEWVAHVRAGAPGDYQGNMNPSKGKQRQR